MRREALSRDVVLVDSPAGGAHVEGVEGLAGREALEPGDAYLDDEAAAGLEVGRDVAEARDLRLLRRQVGDRIEDQVGDRERSVHGRRCEVANRHVDVFATRLCAQFRGHRLRQLNSVHQHSPLRERQRDPSRPDPELERASASRGLEEEVDDRRLEHLRRRLVVPRGDALVEVAVVVMHGRHDSVREHSIRLECQLDEAAGRRGLGHAAGIKAARLARPAGYEHAGSTVDDCVI